MRSVKGNGKADRDDPRSRDLFQIISVLISSHVLAADRIHQ